jgi:hypothetical protein
VAITQHPSVEVCPTCGGTDLTVENGLFDAPVTICHACVKTVTPVTFGEYDAARINRAAEEKIAHAPQVVGTDHISKLMEAVTHRTHNQARDPDWPAASVSDEEHEQKVDAAVERVEKNLFDVEQPSENTGVGEAKPRFTLGILDESFNQPD